MLYDVGNCLFLFYMILVNLFQVYMRGRICISME